MKPIILVAGGTGNLGKRIVNELLQRKAEVRIIVRASCNPGKVSGFRSAGATVIEVDVNNVQDLTLACEGVTCVVSALAGLRNVIVDAQSLLLEAAVAAGVPRFIPSDYSVNFTSLPPGENRNFDLRRAFHKVLEAAPVKATSIYNGAFADILTYNIPILDVKKKMVGYWGDDPQWKLYFTTMDNTAAYTAEAALDNSTPRSLNIAGFQVSPFDLCALANEIKGEHYKLVPLGSLEDFAANTRMQRASNAEGENVVYPRWQSAQYMHDMFSVQIDTWDNARYTGINWTGAKQFLLPLLSMFK